MNIEQALEWADKRGTVTGGSIWAAPGTDLALDRKTFSLLAAEVRRLRQEVKDITDACESGKCGYVREAGGKAFKEALSKWKVTLYKEFVEWLESKSGEGA